jgi:hypothetical protein
MSEQDQQNQQNQTDGQGQSGAQAGAGSGAAAPNQAAGQKDQSATGGQQSAQAGGRSAAGGQQGAAAQGDAHSPGTGQASQQQTETPGIQAGGYKLSLSEAQRKRLVDDGVLELSEEQYTGGVRQQIEAFKRRATAAERRLAEIAAAQEETERKALEEQERFKELYEKERQAREKEASGRKDDAIRARFLLAAQSKGIVDPDVAFIIARSLPPFGAVQVDDEGKVTGIDEVVETLVKEKPYLVSQPQQQKPQSVGAASNPAQQSPPPPKNLAEAGDRLEQALRTGVT